MCMHVCVCESEKARKHYLGYRCLIIDEHFDLWLRRHALD